VEGIGIGHYMGRLKNLYFISLATAARCNSLIIIKQVEILNSYSNNIYIRIDPKHTIFESTARPSGANPTAGVGGTTGLLKQWVQLHKYGNANKYLEASAYKNPCTLVGIGHLITLKLVEIIHI
jgi:hypothetical protein